MMTERKVGDLKVWWIPQVPMTAFEVEVSSITEGVKILNTLADYDLFQLKHNVKPDYCNAGGLVMWDENSDGEGIPGWVDWYDEETGEDDPVLYLTMLAAAPSPTEKKES